MTGETFSTSLTNRRPKAESLEEVMARFEKLAQAMPVIVNEIRAHATFESFWWEIRQLPVQQVGDQLLDMVGIKLIEDNDIPWGYVEMRWSNRKRTRHLYFPAEIRRKFAQHPNPGTPDAR